MCADKGGTSTARPRTTDELKTWIREHLRLPARDEHALTSAIDDVLGWQRQLLEESKRDALQAVAEGFTSKLGRLHMALTEKETTVSNIARYFEEIVADLTEKSHQDPKTKLLNFDWFMERLESFLAIEQRGLWCGVGVVDITSFKWFNDTLGHAVGDKIIERVARILAEQIRSEDLLALDRRRTADLHARFGGDEFCFLVPDLPGPDQARMVAERFKHAVESHDWSREHPDLVSHPVRVDVGVVCLHLGPVGERRGIARRLSAELIQWGDKLMYAAKNDRASHVYPTRVTIEAGELREIAGVEEEPPVPQRAGARSARRRRS